MLAHPSGTVGAGYVSGAETLPVWLSFVSLLALVPSLK